MTEEQLMYATMLALTKQNMAQKIAPASTTLMQGQVINRNINPGDTVCCYYNDSGELMRIGDVLAHVGNFFVDDNSRFYDLANGYIRIRDGLNGYVYEDQNTPAYAFNVLNGGACCAYQITNTAPYIWRHYFPDGEFTEFEYPESAFVQVGYHNGLIGISWRESGRRTKTSIYSKSGLLIASLMDYEVGSELDITPYACIPINESSAAVRILFTGFASSVYFWMIISTSTVEGVGEWADYHRINEVQIGNDQSYYYESARLTNPEDDTPLDIWVLIRWGLDSSASVEEVARFYTEPVFNGPPDQYGSIVENVDGDFKLHEISTQQQLYSEVLPTVPNTNLVRENEGFIWIDGAGVYQKTAIGWLMYPTSVYPRFEPYGKLGYSIRNTRIGYTGLAVVLFE